MGGLERKDSEFTQQLLYAICLSHKLEQQRITPPQKTGTHRQCVVSWHAQKYNTQEQEADLREHQDNHKSMVKV